MSLVRPIRRVVAGACFALSAVWGVSGALKLIFGIRITFSLFPPLDLTRVEPWSALSTALGLMLLGALVGRSSERSASRDDRELDVTDPAMLPPEAPAWRGSEVRPESRVRR